MRPSGAESEEARAVQAGRGDFDGEAGRQGEGDLFLAGEIEAVREELLRGKKVCDGSEEQSGAENLALGHRHHCAAAPEVGAS